jgi:hypothetical protein
MDCAIINLIKEKGQIIGVLIQVENGDTQYLTIEEHNIYNTNGK